MTIKRVAALQIAVIAFLAMGMYVWAQTLQPVPPNNVISGTDIGFRLERTDRNRAIGSLMVRVDGKWLVANFTSTGPNVVPLESR